MFTCTKIFPDFPFAHRQHRHAGHCSKIHGHNWSFEITFACDTVDENLFVIDFGKLKGVKSWLTEMFDHTLVLNEDDPFLEVLTEALTDYRFDSTSPSSVDFADIRTVPNCGAEGLAKFVCDYLNSCFKNRGNVGPELTDFVMRGGRVKSVTVHEDSKNSATYNAL